MRYTCPVCFFPKLPYPPRDYHICPCCGTEFGNDDADFSYAQLREMWLAGGASWFFGRAPAGWHALLQLITFGNGAYFPSFQSFVNIHLEDNATAAILQITQPAPSREIPLAQASG